MNRSRPAPLLDASVFHSAPPTLEAASALQPSEGSGMPVRNTFIDFSEHQVLQPITAPGKFVGRLAGPVAVPATPAAGAAACSSSINPSPASAPPSTMTAAPPPPLKTPHLPAEVRGGALPPMRSPHLPPEVLGLRSTGIPPPPQASPSGIPPPPQASPTVGEAQKLAGSPLRQPVQQGSIIEVRSMGQVTSPPRYCPPTYTVAFSNFMMTPNGAAMPPPMHSPVCATPASACSAPAAAPGAAPVGPAITRCFPASVVAPPPAATPMAVSTGMMWPATPF